MALEGWDPLKYEKQFAREALNATKRAGRRTGKVVIKKARKELGKVDPKRRRMMKYKVRRNGTLAHLDTAVDARIRETGMRAKAKPGKFIRVNFDKKYRGVDGDFVTMTGNAGNRNILVFKREGDRAKPIAILKKSIRRKPVDRSKRLSVIAEREFPKHMDRIHEELING